MAFIEMDFASGGGSGKPTTKPFKVLKYGQKRGLNTSFDISIPSGTDFIMLLYTYISNTTNAEFDVASGYQDFSGIIYADGDSISLKNCTYTNGTTKYDTDATATWNGNVLSILDKSSSVSGTIVFACCKWDS